MGDLNLFAVLIAAVLNFGVAMIWYLPQLFGTMWCEENNMDPNAMGKPTSKEFMSGAVLSLILASGLGHFMSLLGVQAYADGFIVAFCAWVGFMIPPIFSGTIWEKKTPRLAMIHAGCYLVSMLVMSVVFTFMQ